MRQKFPLSQRDAATLRAQAMAYRDMAQTAHSAQNLAGLLKVADRYDAAADNRERAEVHQVALQAQQRGGWAASDVSRPPIPI
jgi:hypothetical protein